MAVAQAKEGIEKELTCPLCFDIFQDPKRLPCDHIYCKDPCLQGLVLRSFDSTITCPECRTVVQVPHNDVNNLPTAFQINRLKELYHTMPKKDETVSPQTPVKQNEQATCATHVSEPIALYCETCDEALCRDCVIKSDKHKQHQYGYIEEVGKKQRKVITSQIEAAKKFQSQLSAAVSEVSRQKRYAVTQGKTYLDNIEARFEMILAALTKEKELLKTTTTQKLQKTTAALASQETELTTRINEMSEKIEQVETTVQNQGNEEIPLNKKNYVEELEETCQKVQDLHLHPTEIVDFGLLLTSPSKIVCSYKEGNLEYPLADPQKCSFEGLESLEPGKTSTAILRVRDFSGKKCTYQQNVQVELLCIRDNSVKQANIELSTTSRYIISITPDKRGRHEISLKVNNTHITGSPIPVYVHMPPQHIGESVSIITDTVEPVALTCFGDKLYVTSGKADKLTVINENWNIVLLHEFIGMGEIAIESETENWFVSDPINHQLHNFDKHGRLHKSVGGRGKDNDEFHFPNGLQMSRSGEIFVCDTRNHRIKVYNRDLQLQRIIGHEKQGGKKGYFSGPSNLAFDESGNVYVTEQDNNRVQVISHDGKTIRTFGKVGDKPGKISSPVGIAIRNRYVYIVESENARVSVFTTRGDFVTTFGNDYLKYPECIAIDRDGYIYVSDSRETIFVF